MKIWGLLVAAALVAGCAGKDDTLDASATADAATAVPGGTFGGPGLPPPDSVEYFNQVVGDRVFFDTDRYNLDAEAQATLTEQARWLNAQPAVRATIEGHADERGTREYNLALGARRANSVRDYLVAQGVPPGRLDTVSYGKERPVALGSDPQSWAQNRRAVTVVLSTPLG
ncbi:MAG TPA: peptidoglycan-associated lipoprotein Pal [Thermohalobaculum sp.]|nr:peptidoglycan-associated lipoprotein Pal [Thermohalobaculum sp.]